MATQTAGAVCPVNAVVEFSATGTSAWNDFTGEVTTVTPSGGERASGEAYTFAGEYGIPCWGKRAPIEVTIRTVYSEATADYLDTIWTYYTGSTPVYLRYSPSGTANWNFKSSVGRFTNVTLPDADAGANEPLSAEITFRAGYWTQGSATT